MRVEIYGDANRETVSGTTVQFTADDAAPVTDLKAQINPSIAGYSSVTIAANGQNTNVSLTKTVYGGSVDVTTGVVTETHGGGAYNPTAVPADLSSKIVSATKVKSASGNVASFNCTLGEYPMSALTAAINPVQDLHGFDRPWPGGGGKNLCGPISAINGTYSDGVWTTPALGSNNLSRLTFSPVSMAAASYTLSFKARMLSGSGAIHLANLQTANNTTPATSTRTEIAKPTLTSEFQTYILRFDYSAETEIERLVIQSSSSSSALVIEVAEIQLELGSTASGYEPYENLCPITGWAGATIHVSPTTSGGTTYYVTFPTAAGTVYGGTLDVVNGVLTVTWKKIALGDYAFGKTSDYNFYISAITDFKTYGSSLTRYGQGISDTFKFLTNNWTAENNTCTCYLNTGYNGYRIFIHSEEHASDTPTAFRTWLQSVNAGFAYELATPITYQLTPQDIATILGQNNVWADTGDVTVSYRDGLLSNVSGIMTNSTALTAGENITYTLSQERTFQIPGTVIRTVVGNNVMSASTGNISVTWSSHWFDITPWIAYQGLTFSRNDVDSPDAGRDMSGYMHRGRVGVKEKMNITTVQLTRAQSSKLQTLLYPETIQVRVTPYPRTNTSHTMSMYTNNVKTTYVIHRENGEDLQSLTFPLIEN